MQFKRMLILMLGLFVALDLFLYVSWQQGFQNNVDVNAPSSDIIQEMKKQNITLPRVSQKTYEMSYMAAESDTNLSGSARLYGGMLNYNIKDGALNLNFRGDGRGSLESGDSYYRAEIEKWGYQYNHLLSQAKDVHGGQTYAAYSQTALGWPVLAKTGLLEVTYDRTSHQGTVVQHRLSAVERLRESEDTISEQAAIEDLYRYNVLNSGDKLSTGELGYDVADHYDGKDIYQPVWLFLNTNKNGDKSLLKVNAFTGEQVS
ncbi:two-component system regulatory protein YycI [Lactobacillaceae bacterium L1_55_11]|nr:two-component system regulatory protein YycI [Lactobacillaceae bacterium L1_55_11]